MKHEFTTFYYVLARGCSPFKTDSQAEALEDAACKAAWSDHVTVYDIYDRVVIEYQDRRVKIPFYGIKQLED